MHSHGDNQGLVLISRLCGWIYFIAWSLSFYPQPALNIKRKTTDGLTLDYPLLNVFGFACYTISTAVFLYSSVVRKEYADRHPASPEPTVRFNDLAFGLHAFILCVVTLSQFWSRLWGWKPAPGKNKGPNKVTLGLLFGGILGCLVCVVIVLAIGKRTHERTADWGWIDVMYALTYVKLLFTVFKYIPQVLSNYRRQSTAGWAINQVLCDFTGGVFSLAQLVIDSSMQADWSGLTGNPVKLGLAGISLFFDVIFIVQHFVLYGAVEESDVTKDAADNSQETDGTERQPLLD